MNIEKLPTNDVIDGWAAVTAGCDTTGWDCQASAEWHWAATRDQVIPQGLTQAERRLIGVDTPPAVNP